jgi:hypothetical protein
MPGDTTSSTASTPMMTSVEELIRVVASRIGMEWCEVVLDLVVCQAMKEEYMLDARLSRATWTWASNCR